MAREINLVPDIKGEMIKALKLRNLILFICIVVAAASAAVIVVTATISIAQQNVVNGKKDTITALSKKLNEYSDLSEFLTIKDQLGNLSSISGNKKVLSRSLNVLSTLLPNGPDTITLSELNITLGSDATTFNFDAQADANSEPYIDYNVLDSFKKSMQYMRYDYGTYVDKNGSEIPAYCIIESGDNGATFSDASRGYFALWTINGEGCNPSDSTDGYNFEDYGGQSVVRIWRTPQYADWYKSEQRENEPYMSASGEISGVPHFESQCISYSGAKGANDQMEWTTTNDTCLLVPEGIDGIKITDSSNGRGANGKLVLRFTARINLSPEVFSFNNKHVLTIPPSGRYNVTDSYVQVQKMFAERAADCAPGDADCSNNTNNSNGGNNG